MPVSEEGRKRQLEALARGRANGGGRKFALGDGRKRGGKHKPSCGCFACDPSKRPQWPELPLSIEVASKRRPRGQRLKKKLIAAGLKSDICELCGQLPFWNGKRLVLQLDHIDGDETNNAVINLRVACPNCHSQTPTFSGKKRLVAEQADAPVRETDAFGHTGSTPV